MKKAGLLGRIERILDAVEEDAAEFRIRWQQHGNRRTLIAIVIGGLLATVLYITVIEPPVNFPVDELVSVPEGQSLAATAQLLKEDGVIRSTIFFRAVVTLLGAERSLHAGDYQFQQPLDILSVARAIAIGQYGLQPVKVRVPEGATAREIGGLFAAHLSRFDEENFIAQATNFEGYLFPDTYFFLPNATENTVLQAMRQNFGVHVAPLQQEIASSTHSLSDIVIMASILEREAYSASDRRLIAGVLWSRIAQKMPLQVDAAFTYSLGKGTFQLTVKDLTTPSPYNTYINKGLPPTPIGNPSLDSIEAALDPTPTEYLYFLADKSGVTHYCKTYTCQLANKARYF